MSRLVTARIFGDKKPGTNDWSTVPHTKVWGIPVADRNQTLDVLGYECVNGGVDLLPSTGERPIRRLTLFYAEWQTVEDADLTTLPSDVAVKMATLVMLPNKFRADIAGEAAAHAKQSNKLC